MQEAFQGGPGVVLLLLGLPGGVEGEAVPHGVQAFHEDVEVGGRTAGGDLVGEYVDDVAEPLGGGGRSVGLHLSAQEPLEGAGVGELVQRAAGEGDGLVAVAQRDGGAGRFLQAPPAVRVGRGHQRLPLVVGERGEPGEAVGGGLAQRVGGGRVDRGGAQFGDERGDGEGAARAAGDVAGFDAQLGQEAGGLITVVGGGLHGGDDEAVAGAGGGDVEEPALLGEEGPGREGFGESVAADPVGLQEGAPAAQVGPDALLDPGDDDEPPLQALGAVSGHQTYGVRAGGPPCEGVRGDVLGVDLFEEVEGPAPAGALLGARRRLEQGAHRVEIAVGVAPARPAAQRGPLQSAGPGGAVPQGPQGFLGGAAAFEEFAGLAQERAEALCSVGVRRVVGDEPFGLGQGAGQQCVGGCGDPDPGGALLVAQSPAEAAQVGGVHGAERGGEKGEGGLGVEPGCGLLPGPLLGLILRFRFDFGFRLGGAVVQRRRSHRPQRRQQGGDGRFVAQRKVVAVDLQGDAGGGEGTADGGQRAASGPYQHGHLLPRHPVLQMGAAQQVRDVLQLRGRGRVGVRLDEATVPDGGRVTVDADRVGGQPGQGHPAGEQPGRREQSGPGAA